MSLNIEQLATELASFIGTEHYYKINNRLVVTDGVKYLADHAHCYWLLILYASHLASVNGEADSFTVLKLVRQGSGADIAIEDGNDQVLAAQHVEYTDFPFNSFSLFACWNGEYWIAMLVSEYQRENTGNADAAKMYEKHTFFCCLNWRCACVYMF